MFDETIRNMLIEGTWATLYMTLISTLFGYIAGLPLGIVLTITDKEGIKPNKIVYKLLDFIVNLTRSIPFLILLILVMPLTKVIVGQTYGSTATIVPLTIAAAQSMGAGTFTIIWKVLLAEARTSLWSGSQLQLEQFLDTLQWLALSVAVDWVISQSVMGIIDMKRIL